MSTINTRPSNGVSWGIKHTLTADDVSDGSITVDFQADVDLVADVKILDANGEAVAMTGVGISFPADGQILIEDASTPVLEADGTLIIVACKASALTHVVSAGS